MAVDESINWNMKYAIEYDDTMIFAKVDLRNLKLKLKSVGPDYYKAKKWNA